MTCGRRRCICLRDMNPQAFLFEFSAVLVLFLSIGPVSGDPCKTAVELTYLTERRTGYKLGPSEKPICDYYIAAGWYSMVDNRLASTTTGCGTGMNWYMKGTLPTGNSIVDIEVCRNVPSGCGSPKTIQAMKCGQYYIFNLEPTDACSEAYCIEPVNAGSSTGTFAAPDIAEIKPTVVVGIIPVSPDKGEHIYYCDFTSGDATLWYRIDWSLTTGFSKAVQLYRTRFIKYNQTQTALREQHLKNNGITKIGYRLMCSVVAKASPTGKLSSPRESPDKFFGIEVVTKRTLRVDNQHSDTFSIRLTVPFACPTYDTDCELRLQLFVPNLNTGCKITHLANVKGVERNVCGLLLKNKDKGSIRNMTVANVLPDINNPGISQEFRVILQAINFLSHDMVSQAFLDPIKVESVTNTNKLSNKDCSAHSDPHMKTFDQKTFENQNRGTFIMYRNADFNVEVQIRTVGCFGPSSSVTCIRALAARAGKDVFVINMDATKPFAFTNCDDGVLRRSVKRKGTDFYEIFLPTGTKVHIGVGTRRSGLLEVSISPSLEDMGKADGLCGNFDGIDNDRIIPPGRSSVGKDANLCWSVDPNPMQYAHINSGVGIIRNNGCADQTFEYHLTNGSLVNIKSTEDLFNIDNYKRLHSWEQKSLLCTCDESSVANAQQGIVTETVVCKADTQKECIDGSYTIVRNDGLCSISRKKRDIHQDIETDFHGTFRQEPRTIVRRAAVNYTAATAKQACIEKMNTTTIQMCKQIPGLDFSSYYTNCELDALASNSMEWTQIHVEAIKQLCIRHVKFHQPIPPEILANITVPSHDTNLTQDMLNNTNLTTMATVTPTTGTPVILFTLDQLQEIEDVSCPNDCSGKGNCIKGVCKCNTGLMGEDCSIDANMPPEMIGIPDKGKCDLSQRECSMTSVLGRTFVETPSLTCRLKPYTIATDGNMKDKQVFTVRAELESAFEVFCNLSSTRHKRSTSRYPNADHIASGYHVSVSNNGEKYSQEDTIMIFDSTCVDCKKLRTKVTCVLKAGFCMDEGRCFSEGGRSGCYTCIEEKPNSMVWSSGKDCEQAILPPGETGKLWIIGATVGPVCVIVIVTVAALCFFSKKNANANQKMGSVNPILQGETKS